MGETMKNDILGRLIKIIVLSALLFSASSLLYADLKFINRPNPFNVTYDEYTYFEYYLDNESVVTIRVYSMTGKLVRTIIENEKKKNGYHEDDTDKWDGKNANNEQVAGGVYLAVIDIKSSDGKTGIREIRKILVMK